MKTWMWIAIVLVLISLILFVPLFKKVWVDNDGFTNQRRVSLYTYYFTALPDNMIRV